MIIFEEKAMKDGGMFQFKPRLRRIEEHVGGLNPAKLLKRPSFKERGTSVRILLTLRLKPTDEKPIIAFAILTEDLSGM